jgi:formylmethanofuran dehydrogenase subunit D
VKKLFLSISIICLSFFAMAQQQLNQEPFMVKSLSAESIEQVKVQTPGGSIVVEAVSPSEARVEVYIRSGKWKENLSKEEIKKRLDEDYELTVTVAEKKLVAIAKNKSKKMNWKNALSISFKVFVAKNISTDLSTSGGSINLTGVSGNQRFITSGGSLTVANVSGKINGTTSGGSISVSNSSDEIELTTSGGSISAANCTGKIKLTTSGGSLKLDELSGDIEANTSGGNINGSNIGGTLSSNTSGGNIHLDMLTCSLDAATTGGNISIGIKELGKYIKLNNSGGNIELEMPKGKGLDIDFSASKINTNGLENFTGRSEKGIMKGTLNGGGIPVALKSTSGNISFTLK